jgi:adenylate cyclase
LGFAEFFDWDWSSAEREFKRAIELNPNNALSHRRYGELLQARARFTEAITEGKHAQELVPLSPDVLDQLAYVYMLTGRYDESVSQYQRVLDLNPSLPSMHASLAWVYAMQGLSQKALAEYDKISEDAKIVKQENQVIVTLYQQHSPGLVFLGVDPFWYGMRSDHRYTDLLRRIGLPQPN